MTEQVVGEAVDRWNPESEENTQTFAQLKRTARIAGLWYLALGVAGMLGFLIIRPQIFIDGDATATFANLTDQGALARTGLLLELGLVAAQALAAVWFFKLFRTFNHTAAWALAAFGMANAIAIMGSAVFMATAQTVVGDVGLAPGGDPAATVQLMFEMSESAWGVGSLFFGLWLIPMGFVARTSGLMPKWLGRILVVGGFGYVLGTFVGYALADAPVWLVEGLVIPASIGEFWMIGYLLFVGLRNPVVHRIANP